MAYRNNSDYIRKIMLVNPPSLSSLKQAPCEDNKLFKHIIELPVFGTLIYHIACAREAISSMFMEQLFYNPFHVTDTLVDTYYESAHKGGSNAKYLYSSYIGKYLNISINNAVESSDACIYIISGKKEASGSLIAEEYQKLNSSIETATIPDTRHLPHIEDPEHFLEQVSIFSVNKKSSCLQDSPPAADCFSGIIGIISLRRSVILPGDFFLCHWNITE